MADAARPRGAFAAACAARLDAVRSGLASAYGRFFRPKVPQGLLAAARALVAAAKALAATACGLVVGACGDRGAPAEVSSDAPPPWSSTQPQATPRPGMVWIPKGTLIAGTPRDKVPRVADAEMGGEQVVLEGFYIDIFPYPNEPGALPTANITADEAAGLCNAQGKRLCSELELERACKGPDNTTYPYGDEYRREPCGPGAEGRVVPNGFHAGCKSGFGVQDTHGSVWVWTSSPWGRGTEGLVAIRGGSSSKSELVGRCANGRGVRPDTKRVDLGVRCCAGPANTPEVSLSVDRGAALRLRIGDDALAKRFETAIEALPSLEEETDLAKEIAQNKPAGHDAASFQVERTWTWHPLGNEELVLAGGCSAPPKKCGLFVARDTEAGLSLLALVATDEWQPTIGETESSREIFVHGGDDNGAFRKRLAYDWGRLSVGDKQRKKKHKGKFRYD
ncbi:MAG TPA: SUMF1/EgtB/PvdO family nonheme iron enzyme [Polyangiaceae bacterium]|nr:SUMF1/EgtB/PvdO family nonheme iron enzyme [Polyangiaceae bacterium]